MTTCPVLTLTPDVRAMHDLFRRTHETRLVEGARTFTRVSLPREGGLQDQDAREMLSIEVIADATRRILREQDEERARAARRKAEKEARQAPRLVIPRRGARRG